jgi:hypothetical protein
MTTLDTTRLHVRFEGRSDELDLQALQLTSEISDAELRAALARHYDRTPDVLDGYLVVREPQAIIVRPVAFYG